MKFYEKPIKILGKTKNVGAKQKNVKLLDRWCRGISTKLSHHSFVLRKQLLPRVSAPENAIQLNVLIIACLAAVKRFPMQLVKCATLLPGKTFF